MGLTILVGVDGHWAEFVVASEESDPHKLSSEMTGGAGAADDSPPDNSLVKEFSLVGGSVRTGNDKSDFFKSSS